MERIWHMAALGVALGVLPGAALGAAAALLPREGEVASGVRCAGQAVVAGAPALDIARDAVARALGRRVVFTHGEQPVLSATLAELGAEADPELLARQLERVARGPTVWARLDEALEARRGRVQLAPRVGLPVDDVAARLERLKDEQDTPARDARLDLATRTASGERPGRYLDVYDALAALDAALARAGDGQADLVIAVPERQTAPAASAAVVAAIDTSEVLARYQTRFGFQGAQSNRAKNIARAASQMEGVVIMPGEVVSFNANVGPRSEDNGFFTAPEIYKGEMREGIGGGTCQVSGTLHAAAYFAGLEVVERSHHSRPSGYLRMGLDATVVYPIVDFKLKNPFDFPVVVHSTIALGALTFELLGRARPASVDMELDTVGIADFKRKVEEAAWLPSGKVVKKQKGIRGYSIRRTRRIQYGGGQERVEVTTDVYPPTLEIYLVPPGTNLDDALPPLGGPAPTTQG
ncbi:MAG: VanW family protein [Polyangiaceae bacterium]